MTWSGDGSGISLPRIKNFLRKDGGRLAAIMPLIAVAAAESMRGGVMTNVISSSSNSLRRSSYSHRILWPSRCNWMTYVKCFLNGQATDCRPHIISSLGF